MNAKNVGKSLVSGLFLSQIIFPTPGKVTLNAKYAGKPFLTAVFFTHHVRVLTGEDP